MKKLFIKPKTTNADPFHLLNKNNKKADSASSKTKIITGQIARKLGSASPSKASLLVVAMVSGLFGGYFIYQSFAAETADVTVSVDRAAPNGTSKWVPAHTSVSNEFYSPWGQNQGPDTTAGTAQYNARELEKEGITQHNVHIMAWARSSPWLNETDGPPDPNLAYNTGRWGGQGMDQEIKRAADKGLQPTITLAMAPGWMIGKRTSGNGIVAPIPDYDTAAGFYQARVTTDKMNKWLQLVDSIVKRYSKAPYNVRTYDIWNEFKGYYNPDTNNYDAGTYCGTPGKADMGYTCFYNKTRAQIMASAASVGVASGIRTGGPYVVSDIWDQSGAGGYPVTDGRGSANNVLSGAKSYGWVDGRSLDAIKTWLANKSGAEFIALRFSNQTRADTILGSDWDSLKFAGDLATWVRGLPESTYPGASTLPFWNAEHYTTPKVDATVDAKQAAFSAESYRIGIRAGYEAMLRWGADGLDGLDLWTTTSVPNNHELRTGNGQPGNGHTVQKLFKQHFSKDTQLYKETISDPTKVSALANSTHTLLINKTNTILNVSVDGVLTTLSPYAVVAVAKDSGSTPTGDTEKPALSWLKPTEGATVSGYMFEAANSGPSGPCEVSASDNVGVTKVKFYAGSTLLNEELTAPYNCKFDTAQFADGSYTLKAEAYDAAGNMTAATRSVTVKNSTTPITPTGWELLYQDDFNTLNTNTVDLPNKVSGWSPYYSPGHAGNGLRRPEAFSIITDQSNSANKLLQIKASMNSSGQIVSGGMSNKTDIAYGKYEVRVRTEADPTGTMSGVALTWPQSGVWPGDGELDWYETGTSVARNPIRSFFHWPCNEGACTYNADGSRKDHQSWATHYIDATQWHTYVMEWTPSSIKMFRDGQLIKMQDGTDAITDPKKIPDVPHHVSLQLDAFANRILAQSGVHMYVDYVKVYKMSSTTNPATPPSVSIASPRPGETIRGGWPIQANASASNGISKVEFYLGNSTTPLKTESAAPYCLAGDNGALPCYSWDSNSIANGNYTLRAVAYDNSVPALKSEASVDFRVENTVADTTDPVVNIKFPPNNSAASDMLTTEAIAYDPPSTTNGSGITKVDFYIDDIGAVGAPRMSVNTTVPASYKYTIDTKTLPNGPHDITAKAYDAAGRSSLATVRINVNNSDLTSPSAPTNLAANAISSSQIDLSWSASSDNVGVVKYNILRKGPNDPSHLVIGAVNAPETKYSDKELTASTSYSYYIQAVDAAGNVSSDSNIATAATPTAVDTTAPNAPANLAANAISSSQINLSWSASSDNAGGSGIAGYNIYRGTSDSNISTKVNSSLVTGSSFGDNLGLLANTRYYYQVEAVDASNNLSARSNTGSAQTQALDINLRLINADSDQVISSLSNGMVIDLNNARNLNIDASATGAAESMLFNDNNQITIESFPPYAIGGDAGTNSPDYYPWTPTIGSHSLTVKAYSADGGSGSELGTISISFNVVDSGVANPSIEAETMTVPFSADIINDSTASNLQALKFYVNGTSSGQISLDSPTSKIVVRAKGDQCRGAPRMTVSVNGSQTQSVAVSNTIWADYAFAANLSAGNHNLSIEFSEDYSQYAGKSNNLKCSRDLYVDQATFYKE